MKEKIRRDGNNETPIIIASTGLLNGITYMVSNEVIIGRDPQCEIFINDRQISRFHAKLELVSQNQVLLTDLESKNGTFVNGERISNPVILNDGDEIKMALAQSFTFLSSDSTIPLNWEPVPQKETKRLIIDSKARIVWIGDAEISPPLSVSQFDLLELLFSNENEVVSRQKIVEEVWGVAEAIGVTEQAIDALVRRLRDRLKEIDPEHEYIHTVRGVGFLLRNKYL